MANLTPRTRSESFLNGEDLEPITRREHFYAGKENELPEGHQEPETREEWFIQKYREAGDVTVESLSITENGTYTAPSGKAYSPVSVDVPLPSNAYLLKSIEHDPIASFSDGTDNFVKSLEVAIEPQQDLHGYDAPWVGGAGKNKLQVTATSQTINGVTFTVNDDGSVLVNGTATEQVKFILGHINLTANTSYICNGAPQGGGSAKYAIFDNISGFKDYGDGSTYTPAEDKINIEIRIQIEKGNTLTNKMFYPMIRLATVSDATFAPYSNECPISGWDEVNVTVADDTTDPTTENVYTIDLNGTRYGGTLDVVSGVLTVDRGYIASYNGETLPSTWISDRDVYAEGTTPTIGAEVVYELATPQTIQLSPTIIKSLQGDNNFFADSGEVIKLQYWGR